MFSRICVLLAASVVIALGSPQALSSQAMAGQLAHSRHDGPTSGMVEDVVTFTGFVRGQPLTPAERHEVLAVMTTTYAADRDFLVSMCRDMHDSLEALARRGSDGYAKAALREAFLDRFYRTPPPVVADAWFTLIKMVNLYNPLLARSPKGTILTHRDAQGYLDFVDWVAERIGQETPVEPDSAGAERDLAATFAAGQSDMLLRMGRGEALWNAFQLAQKIPALQQEIDDRIDWGRRSSNSLQYVARAVAEVVGHYLTFRADAANGVILASVGPYRLTDAMFEDYVTYCETVTGRVLSRSDVDRLRKLEIAEFYRAPEANVKNYASLHALLGQRVNKDRIVGLYPVIQESEKISSVPTFAPSGVVSH
jgi:hypothetical protein